MGKRILCNQVGISNPDIYTSGNTKLQDEKFLEQLSKNIFIYESETILGPFTKTLIGKLYETNK